jgi:Zn finger protein HypA/HybF involved in hydrogenase expression
MNCQFCFAPLEEENIKQKSCPKCKADIFIIEKNGIDFIGEAIKGFDSKIFNFSLKALESHLDKSIKAEDFLGFHITLCPFCSSPLFLKNLCDASNDEKGITLKFLQKEKKEIKCQWCGKINTQIKGGANTENVFLPFKTKSEFEKNLEKFLSQPPIPNIEEKKGCLSIIFLFPFFK